MSSDRLFDSVVKDVGLDRKREREIMVGYRNPVLSNLLRSPSGPPSEDMTGRKSVNTAPQCLSVHRMHGEKNADKTGRIEFGNKSRMTPKQFRA
jgi:hypothetical protein